MRLGKDIENRRWYPPHALIGERIAIHAGKTWDETGLEFIRSLGLECPGDGPEHPTGIVGTARLVGTVGRGETHSRWYMGEVGWRLADVRELPAPLPCRGYQKTWTVPASLAEQLR